MLYSESPNRRGRNTKEGVHLTSFSIEGGVSIEGGCVRLSEWFPFAEIPGNAMCTSNRALYAVY